MLDLAINHKDNLKAKFKSIWFDDKYKFWNACSYYKEFVVDTDTWNKHQFVSIDRSSGNDVIGYIGYDINRDANSCHSLSIINFTDEKAVFGLDLGQLLKDIFEKFKFNKLNFTVIIGNPIERSYDRIIKKYGGRIVGVFLNEVKLIDGQLYDEKIYEITISEYQNAIDNNREAVPDEAGN